MSWMFPLWNEISMEIVLGSLLIWLLVCLVWMLGVRAIGVRFFLFHGAFASRGGLDKAFRCVPAFPLACSLGGTVGCGPSLLIV